MAQMSMAALAMVDAPPGEVRAAVADYREVRPAILPPAYFSGYEVLQGGRGAGSEVRWTLRPGRWAVRQTRQWTVSVEERDGTLVECDNDSDMLLVWSVSAAPGDRSVVELSITWDGPTGFAGVRDRSRVNRLRKVYGEVLLELRKRFAAPSAGTARRAPKPDGDG